LLEFITYGNQGQSRFAWCFPDAARVGKMQQGIWSGFKYLSLTSRAMGSDSQKQIWTNLGLEKSVYPRTEYDLTDHVIVDFKTIRNFSSTH
jgi:hypothetical protein